MKTLFKTIKFYFAKFSDLTARHYNLLILFFIGILFFSLMNNPANTSAKMKRIKWKSQPSTLQVGKSFQYRISGNPKKSKIRFHSNHPKRAKINSKTGKLRAKKQGSVIITAKVTKKNKSAKLKTKLKIVSFNDGTLADSSNNSYLKNVQFTAADNINPWDHSLLLYSNRILLQQEVENTSIQLSPLSTKSNTNENYTASFRSLSSDGKCIRYQLSQADAEKMCPGNGTCDANYSISSSFFSGRLTIKYQERIIANSISGYVVSEKGTSLSGALIQLISESSDTTLATTRSDKNGFYQFTNIPNSFVRLTVSMTGFDSLNVKQLSPYGHALCQNLIMHSNNSDKLALSCQLVNSSKEAITSATVILTDTETQLSIEGQVDQTGCITFAASDDIDSKNYSYIKYQNQLASPVYQNKTFPTAEQFTCDSAFLFRRDTTYQLQILPTLNLSVISDYVPLSFCFSFADIISDQIMFHITLQELPILSSDTISINTDTLNIEPDYYNYTLYSSAGSLLFQTILSAQNNINLTKELNHLLLESSLRLLDGDYFLSISAFDENQIPISVTEIQSISITDGKLSSFDCHLSPASSLQAFLFAKMPKEQIHNPVSFTLYQEFSSIYFPITTCYADDFTRLNNNSCQSLLTLSGIKSDTNYFLLPDISTYCITSNLTMQKSNSLKNIHEDAIRHGISFHTKTPSFQIILTVADSWEPSENIEQNINIKHNDISWDIPIISLSRNYFDSSNTYPNTIYAYHQKDGSLLNISFQSSTNISSAETSFIMNCFKNGTDICTNQSSYRLTPFFVT